jgi:outer membrane receptor protein involved in Fe transport
MSKYFLLTAAAPLALIAPAAAAAESDAARPAAGQSAEPKKEVFSTGVAKGRDRLDQATSTSAIRSEEIHKLESGSVAEIVRNIPGVRVEASSGVANNSYTIRGLPLASIGSKYLQFQEDGLPILEFGDFSFTGADMFLRADATLNAVEAIRGGSASTFASNAPGGVINFITKSGEEQGGSIQATTGIGEELYRVDFTYGGRLTETLRYQIGGFYREGEGPRATGFTGYRGGQIKANITKELPSGYIRLHGKYLDDRTPTYYFAPLRVTGANDKPKYENVANFDITRDTLLSPYIPTQVTRDGTNTVRSFDMTDGINPVAKSVGLEAQFDVAGWTVTERFRFADMSGQMLQNFPLTIAPAAALAPSFAGPGATLSFATGPNAGQAINPLTLSGNGLLATSLLMNLQLNSLDNMTNDIRASRVWDLGNGKLTLTAGFYKSRQSMDTDWLFTSVIHDVHGEGRTALVNLTTATGVAQTQNGVFAYSALPITSAYRRRFDVDFHTNAPYGSLNYHIGKVAIGGSIRFNSGKAEGSIFGSELGGGRPAIVPFDINGDGVISAAESRSGFLPLTTPAPVDYDYSFISYSAGVNYRVAEEMAVFARYSRGGRAGASGPLFTPAHNPVTGGLVDQADAYGLVKQAEAGVKYRKANLTLNLTGFWASTDERTSQINSDASGATQVERIYRTYEAYGVEFEGAYQYGPFSVTAGATWTKAEIAKDQFNAAAVGNTPRHQPDLIYQTTAQYEDKRFTVGANVVGTTGSYAQDNNQLRMPGYTLVNGFVQFRLTDAVELGVTGSNLFDALALTDVNQASIPASGIVTARALNGRTVAASVRFSF